MLVVIGDGDADDNGREDDDENAGKREDVAVFVLLALGFFNVIHDVLGKLGFVFADDFELALVVGGAIDLVVGELVFIRHDLRVRLVEVKDVVLVLVNRDKIALELVVEFFFLAGVIEHGISITDFAFCRELWYNSFMANALDYVKEFGHLSFSRKAFNDIDNVVFSLLNYVDFTQTSINENTHTLEEVGNEFIKKHTYKEMKKVGFAQAEAYLMLKAVVKAERYRHILVEDYIYEAKKELMFSVLTFHLTKNMDYIAFEGTDELVCGWREDFELSCTFPVESHFKARDYLIRHIDPWGNKKVIVGGHSKGGNQALVGSMFLDKRRIRHIVKIYNNDGPGLRAAEFKSKEFAVLKDRYVHIVPHSTVVGAMLHHSNYVVVKSDKENLMSHALLTWQVKGDKFELAPRSAMSLEIQRRLLIWCDLHGDEDRKKILEAVMGVVEQSNIKFTNSIVYPKNIIKIIRQSKKVDRETRDLVIGLIRYVVLRRDD